MIKLQEDEFVKIRFEILPKDCNHPDIVRIYDNGTHVDYGCTVCGMRHTNREAFEK